MNEEIRSAQDGGAVAERSVKRRFNLAALLQGYGVLSSLAVMFIVLSFVSEPFFSSRNILNILDQNSMIGLIAIGGTLVIIGGGFDLSAGSVFAMAAVLSAMVAEAGSPEFAILVGVGAGLAAGVLNGVLVTVGRINSFIATLATAIVLRGVTRIITGGSIVSVFDESFTIIGRERLLGVKYPIWLFALVAVVTTLLMRRTVFGRYVYAVGGNASAARLSGIRVGLIRVSTFAISGMLAGLAGVIQASKVASGSANTGEGLALEAIAAIVIGGTSIMGGRGAVWRSISGVLLLALIGNGFNLLSLPSTYQSVFSGVVIIFAVGLDALARRGEN